VTLMGRTPSRVIWIEQASYQLQDGFAAGENPKKSADLRRETAVTMRYERIVFLDH